MPKILDVSELNGNYSIVYQAQAPEIPEIYWVDHTVANAEIRDGVLIGQDTGGSTWKANITLGEADDVYFTAVVTVENAEPNTFLMDIYGQPSKEAQNYAGTLSILSLGDKLIIFGTVLHGVVSIKINLNRN